MSVVEGELLGYMIKYKKRKDAIALLEQIPEEKVTFVLQILQGIQGSSARDDTAEKDAAYERLEKVRKQVDIDLDPRSELAGAVRHFKETEGGRRQVCNAMEEFSRKIVIKEKEASAIKMIARGKLTMEEIAEDLGLPVERVEELAELQPV